MNVITSGQLYEIYRQHPLVCTDSRQIKPGCLFFALKGESFDGNTFAHQAIASGAAYAVIDNPQFSHEKTLWVPDVLEALQELARLHRQQLQIPVIGITGTNGKTTTKELIHAVLSTTFHTAATQGNLNNHIGVPLTILSISNEIEMAIIEMGANHQGEIGFLSRIARPTCGLITNIGKAHLEGFGGYEGVIKAKSELYHYLRENNRTVFVAGDNPLLVTLSEGMNRITYGQSDSCNHRGKITASDPFLEIECRFGNEVLPIKTKLVGTYNFENVMAAVCIGTYFQVEPLKIKQALEGYAPSNSRSQSFQTERNTIILDAYNANPTSMAAALENFARMQAPDKMVILGGMKELGDESPAEHQTIVELVQKLGFKNACFAGNEFRQAVENSGFQWFATSAELREFLISQKIEHFTLLIKGSRGSKMEVVLDAL